MQFHAKYPLFDSQSERDFTYLAMRFHAKYPLFDSQSDREFTFSYAILFVIYTSKLFDIIKNHLPHVHTYADDTQVYISFKPKSTDGQSE